jgi:diaminopimelate decarboxylase
VTLPDGLAAVLPPNACLDDDGALVIGGCRVDDLAARFGTPLFVYDEAGVRDRVADYVAAFAAQPLDTVVVYASKAFPTVAMAAIVADSPMWIDVSTLGELEAAVRGGVPGERILVHGNNKSDAELARALEIGVARIVCDSFDEIDRLAGLVAATPTVGPAPVPVMIRLTPGVEADTHAFISTGQEDSKFGFPLAHGLDAVRRVAAHPQLRLTGVHCHIGSQLFALDGFRAAADAVLAFCARAQEVTGTPVDEVDLGGGLGIGYTVDDTPVALDDYASVLAEAVAAGAAHHGVATPRLFVEPGRSVVGRMGVTCYTVGTVKEVPGVRTYVAVDGGMSDNLRSALYGARYETILADRPAADRALPAHVAGKHCESGDIVVADARLPADVAPGDLLVTPATGAYGYAMANNYNLLGRPAVVFVADGDARVVVRRETVDDVLGLMSP